MKIFAFVIGLEAAESFLNNFVQRSVYVAIKLLTCVLTAAPFNESGGNLDFTINQSREKYHAVWITHCRAGHANHGIGDPLGARRTKFIRICREHLFADRGITLKKGLAHNGADSWVSEWFAFINGEISILLILKIR